MMNLDSTAPRGPQLPAASVPSDLLTDHNSTSVAAYWLIFFALMLLLGLTVLAAHWNLGALSLLIALLIAGLKAALVVWYFMHVRFASKLTRLFSVAALAWLALLMGLTFSDYLSRGWIVGTGK